MKKQTSMVCRLCGERSSRMGRHLQQCVPKYFSEHPSSSENHTFYLIRVKGRYAPEYVLYLLVPVQQKLRLLDRFLRDVWLECCEHLSSFHINNREVASRSVDDFWGKPAKTMGQVEIGKVLSPKVKFSYIYDFGSPTELDLEVISELRVSAIADRVHLLARSDPPFNKCYLCDEEATQLCLLCAQANLEQALVCERCIQAHRDVCLDPDEFELDLLIPVTNSPRMGVCAYCGDRDPDRQSMGATTEPSPDSS